MDDANIKGRIFGNVGNYNFHKQVAVKDTRILLELLEALPDLPLVNRVRS